MKLWTSILSYFRNPNRLGCSLGTRKNFQIRKSNRQRIAELVESEVVLDGKARDATSLKDRQWFLSQRDTIRWELQTYIIQNSTRTTFPMFLKLHNKLRMKYRWYYNWHLLPYAGNVHWASLFMSFSAILAVVVFSAVTLPPSQTKALIKTELSVREINPEKNPSKFFLKDPASGKFDDVYQIVADTDETKEIRTKSADSFEDLVLSGNTQTLQNGDKVMAEAKIIAQEQVNGVWQEIGAKIEPSPTPSPSLSPEPSPSVTTSLSPSSHPEPSGEGSPTPVGSGTPAGDSSASPTPQNDTSPSPEAMINNLIRVAKAVEPSPSLAGSPPLEGGVSGGSSSVTSDISKQNNNDLIVTSDLALESGQTLSTEAEVKKEGEGKNQKVEKKQTFSLEKGENSQRLVWEIALKDFDITSDSSVTLNNSSHPEQSEGSQSDSSASPQNDKRREYNQTIVDVSDFKGNTRWEEIASSDTIRIYFDEEGTDKAITIDPLLTVTTPPNQISVDDGTRKWVFDTGTAGFPKYFYHTSVGSGSDNVGSTFSSVPDFGPVFRIEGTVSSVTQTLIENTPTRVKIRAQGAYTTSPTAIDNYYTIYPDGHVFVQYSATIAGVMPRPYVVQHYLNAVPQIQNHDDTNHAFVQSDTSNNNYPGTVVVPYTSGEYGGASGWAYSNSSGNDFTVAEKGVSANTYAGNLAIDMSNYRATTTTRDNLRDDYRTPATLANFDKGSQSGDGYNEGEGAYTIAADGSGDAKFDFTKGTPTRYKPAFVITAATRAEDNYQVKVAGVRKTKGVDYNLSKPDATTVTIQWLSDVAANLTDFELTGTGGMQSAVGSYVGDGVDDRGITGLGFQPNAVIIRAEAASPVVWRSSTMVGDSTGYLSGGSANFADGVQSLDADGFTIGTHSTVNTNTTTYHWMAFKDNGAGDFHVGTYTGDDADNRSIAGVGFQPTIVWLKDITNANPAWKTASNVGETMMWLNDAADQATNGIQAFEADGFQLGSDIHVNGVGRTFHYAAFRDISGWFDEGSYTGNGTDNRSITVGFQPNIVWVKQIGAASSTVLRPSTLAGDSTLDFPGNGPFANAIQSFEANGFQVGTHASVNTDGVTYRWAAWKATGSSGATGNKIWDGGGGADTNWSTAANWSDDTVPQSGDNVQFGGTSTNNSTIDAGFAGTINSLTIGTGYTGTITASRSLTVNGDFSLEQGTYNANAQALNIGGSFSRVGGTFTHGNNTTTFTSTSTGKTVLSGGQSFYNLTFNGSGGGWTFSDNISVGNDFTTTAGTVSPVATTLTVSGHVSLAGGGFTAGTSTLVMNGTLKNLIGGGKTLTGLRISGTITLTTSNIILYKGGGGSFVVDADKSLTIDTGRMLDLQTSMATTLNGTIDGAGTFSLTDSAVTLLSTGGTLNAPTRMWAQTGQVSAPARTYGGPVTFFTTSGGPATDSVKLGTAGGQTLNFSSDFIVQAETTGNIEVTGATWNPTINITGNVSYIKHGTGVPSLKMGSGTWTVSGNVDFTNGTVTAGGSTLVMNGLTKTLTGANQTLNNLQISNNITVQTSNISVNGILTVDVGKTLTINTINQTITMNNGSTTTINGTITGAGYIQFVDSAGANLSTGGVLSSNISFKTATASVILPARTYGGTVEVINTTVTSYNATLGTAGGQTLNFSSNFNPRAHDAGNLTIKADTWNPTVNITGDLDYTGGGAGTESISMGSGTWNVGGSVDLRDGTLTAGGSTLVLNATAAGKNIYSNGQSFNNVQFNGVGGGWTLQDDTSVAGSFNLTNGTLNMGATTMTVSGSGIIGFFNIAAGGTFNADSSTVIINPGAWKVMTADGKTFNNLTFSGAGTQIDVMGGSGFSVAGILNVGVNTSVDIGGFRTVTMNAGSTTTIDGSIGGGANATFALVDSAGANLGTGGTLAAKARFITASANVTVPARTYGSVVEFYNNTGSSYDTTLGTAGGQTLTFQSSFSPMASSTGNISVTAATWNPTINITGDLDFTGAGGGTESILMGSGVWSVGGNVDFRDGDVTEGTSTLKLTDTASGKTIWTDGEALNNIEFNGVGGGWTLQDQLSISNFQFSNGTLNAGANTINVSGDWNHTGGTFNADTSTVNLNGTDQQVIGTNTFNNLSKTVTENRTLTFSSDLVQTVSGLLTLKSTDVTKLLSLRSSSSPAQWQINPTGTQDIDYVDLMDAKNNAGIITIAHAKDSGNNTNWNLTDSYAITTHADQIPLVGWTETVSAKDFLGNNTTSDSSTVITMTSSSGHTKFYTNDTYAVETTTYTLSNGVATIYIKSDAPASDTMTITATDPSAKTVTSGQITVLNLAPTAAITAPDEGAVVGAGTVQIAGTAADAKGGVVATVQVQIDSGAWVAATGTTSWSYNYAVSTSGTHTVKARATDSLGLVGAETAAVTFSVDVEIPSVTITKPVVDEWIVTETYTVEGTSTDLGASPIVKVEFSTDGSNWSNVTNTGTAFSTWNYAWTTSNGEVTLYAKATDGVGNISQIYQVKAKVDINPPTKPESAKGFDIKNNLAGTKGVLLSWKASTDEGSGLAKYEVYRDGTRLFANAQSDNVGHPEQKDVTLSGNEGSQSDSSQAQNDSIQNWYIDNDGSASNTYIIKAVDNGGNTSESDSVKPEVTSDTTPLNISDVKADPSVLVTQDEKTFATVVWKTDKPATSQVSFGLGAAKANDATPDGKFNTYHLSILSDLKPQTTYHYQIKSTDMSGNAAETEDLTFTTAAGIQKDNIWDTILKTLEKAFEWMKEFLATAPPTKAVAGVLQAIGVIKSPEQVSPSLIALDVSNPGADLYQTMLLTNLNEAQIERSTGGGSFTNLGTVANNYYLDTGLDKNTTYSYKIKDQESSVSVSPASIDEAAPKITDIKTQELITTAEKSQYLVTFSTDKLTNAEISLDGGTSKVEDGTNQAHSLVLDDLKPSKTYKYTLKAVVEGGQMAESTTQSLTTAEAPTEETIWQLILDTLQGVWGSFSSWMKN